MWTLHRKIKVAWEWKRFLSILREGTRGINAVFRRGWCGWRASRLLSTTPPITVIVTWEEAVLSLDPLLEQNQFCVSDPQVTFVAWAGVKNSKRYIMNYA